ncbi:hypothetical protein CAPTEDRAFT_205591, partial [Capitella teleta]
MTNPRCLWVETKLTLWLEKVMFGRIGDGVGGHGAGFAEVEPHRPGVGAFVDGSERGVDRVGDGCCTMRPVRFQGSVPDREFLGTESVRMNQQHDARLNWAGSEHERGLESLLLSCPLSHTQIDVRQQCHNVCWRRRIFCYISVDDDDAVFASFERAVSLPFGGICCLFVVDHGSPFQMHTHIQHTGRQLLQ